ncbi:MAG TPA: DUF4365 domain-containing protein [Abditibacterium sp.]|jgi:hypothetical protein
MASLISPLNDNDMEEQLSLAYLHMACTSACMGMEPASRTKDNRGVDATINAFGPFGSNDGYLKTVDIDVQLKATIKPPALKKGTHFSYHLKSVSQYDVLRSRGWFTPRILIVLFLPPNKEQWLSHSHDELLLRRCAYWVSLLDAAACTNGSGQTVYLPKSQCLNRQAMLDLCSSFSHGESKRPTYQLP